MQESHLKAIRWITLICIPFWLLSCKSVPITGRQQFLIISESEEIALGSTAYRQTLEKEKISSDTAKVALIKKVGSRIAAVSGRPDFEWEFNLIEKDIPNAFALPGGKVAIYTGILKYTQNETGLAVVMGHEVAHALAHHGAERMSTGMLTQIGAKGIGLLLGKGDPQTTQAVEQAFGIGSQVGIMLPFSRSHESEADEIGLHLMAEAGYDPREAVAFWRRMSQGGGKKPPEFLSTHPSGNTRVKKLNALLPTVLPIFEKKKQGM
ncbi:MAG: M48 family metallopeptidase [Nitrospiria bacterium]